MSDKKPGTVFFDDGVDTRAPAPGIPQPVSSGDIIGANVTLGYQDMAGQPLQAKIDAYTPLINELDKRDTRGWAEKVFGPQYILGVRGGLPINTNKVWGDIAAIRAKEPDFLKDIPAQNDEQFDAWVKSGEKVKRAQAQDIVRREQGFGQKALGFGAGVATGLVDPINVGGMLATGGLAGGAKTLLGSMAREAAINAAIETTELPSTYSNRQQFGETMTPMEMVENVGSAAIGGAILPGAGKVGKAIAAPALEPIGRAVDPLFDGMRQRAAERALGINDLPAATDADVLHAFTDRFPPETRTPETQAAVNVLGREAEVRGASPYVGTPGGLDANAERLATVSDTLSQPASAGTAPVRPQPVGRTAPQLTQTGIIRFVLNDLEGGAKVVPFSSADGGTTKYGVAKKFNPDVDVANITEADAMSIARRKYWLPEFNTADPHVAAIAFDANWISSPSLARRILREAGDDTEKALAIYRDALNHIADTVPGKGKFRKGWNNRVDKLARYVGDNEGGKVRLDPEQFAGDDVAYRAAGEDLNREELQLADDTPSRPDPVREYVDRMSLGDNLSAPEDMRFAADNQPAIDAELAQRVQNGTDGHPDLVRAGEPPVAPVDASAPSRAETALAVRQYVDHGMGDATPEAVSRDLGIDEAAARQALASVDRPPSVGSFTTARGSVYRVEADGTTTRNKAYRPEHGFAEQGPQPTSHATYYVSAEDALKLAEFQAKGQGRVAIQPVGDGRIGLRYLDGKDAGKFERRTVVRPSSEPAIGRTPVELWNDGSQVHFGNDIVALDRAAGFEEPAGAPPSLDPKTYGVDTATSTEAHLLADSAYHDVRALAEAGDKTKAQLTEGGPEMGARELIESLDRDQSALDTIKGCL